MERWGFVFSAVSSPIVYFLTTTRAVCPNINPVNGTPIGFSGLKIEALNQSK